MRSLARDLRLFLTGGLEGATRLANKLGSFREQKKLASGGARTHKITRERKREIGKRKREDELERERERERKREKPHD